MKKDILVLIGLCVSFTAFAAEQSTPTEKRDLQKSDDTPERREVVIPVDKATALRAELTHRILAGIETPDRTLEVLKTHPNPLGFGLDNKSQVGLAAVDIGRRLLVADRPEDAEIFFKAAEEAFDGALAAISAKDNPALRSAILEKRGQIRAEYLGNLDNAKEDLDEALRLSPGDQRLQRLRDYVLKPRSQRKLGDQNN